MIRGDEVQPGTMMNRLLKMPSMSEMLTPKGLLIRAGLLAAIFLVCHLAGLREYTSFLCGMYPTTGAAAAFSAFLGLVYVLMYLAFTVFVPIMVVGAGVIWALNRKLS